MRATSRHLAAAARVGHDVHHADRRPAEMRDAGFDEIGFVGRQRPR
jgi:hypothetical protein